MCSSRVRPARWFASRGLRTTHNRGLRIISAKSHRTRNRFGPSRPRARRKSIFFQFNSEAISLTSLITRNLAAPSNTLRLHSLASPRRWLNNYLGSGAQMAPQPVLPDRPTRLPKSVAEVVVRRCTFPRRSGFAQRHVGEVPVARDIIKWSDRCKTSLVEGRGG